MDLERHQNSPEHTGHYLDMYSQEHNRSRILYEGHRRSYLMRLFHQANSTLAHLVGPIKRCRELYLSASCSNISLRTRELSLLLRLRQPYPKTILT